MLERYEKRYHNLLDPWDNDEQFQNISKCYSAISKQIGRASCRERV